MKTKKSWIELTLFHLLVVSILGIALRSKILFSLPFIQFDYLRNAHSHFAFGGWLTLSLLLGMAYNLLPARIHEKPVYQWAFRGVTVSSWGMVVTFPILGYSFLSISFSTLFIFSTYLFGWCFIRDLLKTDVNKPVRLLAISSVAYLLLSSAGPFTLAFLMAGKSHSFILLRDAVFSYLHFQYNGFFTLAVLSLLFHSLLPLGSDRDKKNIHRLAIWIVISVIPSLFLSFLWHNPGWLIRWVAMAGSLMVGVSVVWFVIAAAPLLPLVKFSSTLLRNMGILSISAFILKMILQCLTIFPHIGNAVFGIRPIIIGFLHLVFLVFVSLFLLVYFAKDGMLHTSNRMMKSGLLVFSSGALLIVALLMIQGLSILLAKVSHLFPILHWAASIWVFSGALLIVMGQRTKNPITIQ